jgi:Subtilase family
MTYAHRICELSAILCWCAVSAAQESPREMKPLQFRGPVPTTPGQAPDLRAFYYAPSGQKIYLTDTGLAVAKVNRAAGQPNLPIAPAGPPEDGRPTAALAQMLGPDELLLNISAHLAEEAGQQNLPGVEYVLPVVVEVVQNRQAQDPAGPKTFAAMTNRVSAKFSRGVTRENIQDLLEGTGLEIASGMPNNPNAYLLKLRSEANKKVNASDLLKAANALFEKDQGKHDRRVLYAKPDFKKPIRLQGNTSVPDPDFNKEWHLSNTGKQDAGITGASSGIAGADIHALGAWAVTMGDPSVAIAILDDSVERDHPDLKPNYKGGRFYNGPLSSDDPSPKDGKQRHGTCCAGVAVAASNDKGGLGIAPKCSLIGVNIWRGTEAEVADAFYFADKKGARIISCSWAWGGVYNDVSVAIQDLATDSRDRKGTIILFAAGNDYGRVADWQIFGKLPEVICVGASNWKDVRSRYSNIGPEVWVVAPSSDYRDNPGSLSIVTTDNTDNMPRIPGVSYSGYVSGPYTPNYGPDGFGLTSSAAPLTAGVCALMLSVNPNLTAQQTREILRDTADKVPGTSVEPACYDVRGHSNYYGFGRVNAEKAVLKARNMRGH